MIILAIDPGPEESAFVVYQAEGCRVLNKGKGDNAIIKRLLQSRNEVVPDVLVIEQVKNYGSAMSESCLETCVWTGRFIEAWERWENDGSCCRIPRKTIVALLCENPRAKDAVVRQALIDKFAGLYGLRAKEVVGTKKNPGPLYGFKGDEWSALAVAVAWWERFKADTAKIESLLG